MKNKSKVEPRNNEREADRYTTIIARGDNWFLARCMELGLIGQGHTEREARENLREAVRRHLGSHGEDEWPLAV